MLLKAESLGKTHNISDLITIVQFFEVFVHYTLKIRRAFMIFEIYNCKPKPNRKKNISGKLRNKFSPCPKAENLEKVDCSIRSLMVCIFL